MKYKLGSLFAGIGGIDLAFEQAKFKVEWANEIDEKASITYRANFKNHLITADIKNIDFKALNKVDVIAGGFPCQAFSVAGYQKGFDDERGQIFYELVRAIEEQKPRAILIENVKNLTTHDRGKTFKEVKLSLEKLGYHLKYKVMNTAEYSQLPQNRERIYLVGFINKDLAEEFEFPKPNPAEATDITTILEDQPLPELSYKETKYFPELQRIMTNRKTCYQIRRTQFRENKHNQSPTLTANMGTGGHNVPLVIDCFGEIRKLSVRECGRLQGFPEEYHFPDCLAKSYLYKQIGNSVSVPVVKKIAQEIAKVLNMEKKKSNA